MQHIQHSAAARKDVMLDHFLQSDEHQSVTAFVNSMRKREDSDASEIPDPRGNIHRSAHGGGGAGTHDHNHVTQRNLETTDVDLTTAAKTRRDSEVCLVLP